MWVGKQETVKERIFEEWKMEGRQVDGQEGMN